METGSDSSEEVGGGHMNTREAGNMHAEREAAYVIAATEQISGSGMEHSVNDIGKSHSSVKTFKTFEMD